MWPNRGARWTPPRLCPSSPPSSPTPPPPPPVAGRGDAGEHNRAITQQLDWEVELAAIIGTRATRVSEAEALKHVFGYSVLIDISARDCRRAGQWIYSKGQDTYAPFGPVIVTA